MLSIHKFFYLLDKRPNIILIDVTLGDIEKIINSDFIQLGAEWLNVNNFSFRKSNKFEIHLRDFFKSFY